MLNAMFNEIKELLGDEYGLVKEFNPHDTRFIEQMNTYDNIGTLYVNNGSLGFIPDGAKMTIYYTLELFIRVKQGINTSDVVVEPLNNLAKAMTGVVYSEMGGYQYVLDLGLPSSDGVLVNGIDGDKFVRYEIPITAILTQGTTLEEPAQKITLSYNDEEYTLKGVLSCVKLYTNETENAVFFGDKTQGAIQFKAGTTECEVVSQSLGYQISKLFRNDDTDKMLLEVQKNSVLGATVTVTDLSGETAEHTKMKVINLQRITQRGQPVLLQFSLVPAMRPL